MVSQLYILIVYRCLPWEPHKDMHLNQVIRCHQAISNHLWAINNLQWVINSLLWATNSHPWDINNLQWAINNPLWVINLLAMVNLLATSNHQVMFNQLDMLKLQSMEVAIHQL